MIGGMYAAISGLDANQTMINNTASNLANVNTVGFKSSRVSFADSLSQVMRGASGVTTSNGGTNPLEVGLGVQVSATENEMTEGSFQTTNNPLDIAIQGEGFLRVGAGSPPAEAPYTSALPTNVDYSRAGNLTTNPKGFLTTQSGLYVVGVNAVATKGANGITYSPGKEPSYLVIPPVRRTSRSGRTGRSTTPTRTPHRRHTRHR